MDHFAFRYVARVARTLAEQSDVGCFLYQNLGEERIQQRGFVEQYMANLGFRLQKVGEVSVFIGSGRFPVEALIEAPPIGDDRSMRRPIDFLKLDRAKMLESYRFFDFIGIGR